MVAQRGQIWWADLGEPRGSGPGYRRPIIVIQANSFNKTNLSTVIVAIVTSNLDLGDMPGNVRLTTGTTGLDNDSVVNITQLLTVDRADLVEYVGSVSDRKMDQIDRGLRLVLSH